ncbi:MAG: imidazolonepropionase [Bacteroidales bacterium]|nr:imidazolonepropionase [Bacteroidales bacterium]
MKTIIKNIGKIIGILPAGILKKEGHEMDEVGSIDNGYIVIEDGRIASFGSMADCPSVTEDGPEAFHEWHCTATGLATGPQEDQSSDRYGKNSNGRQEQFRIIDAEGGWAMPCFCDSHTHLVYAGCRDGEYRDKIAGLSYEEIAERGGGILNSADLLHSTSEDELYRQSMERVREIMAKGTGAVEIKSGYGLRTEDELKMLRVIRRIKETSPLAVKATFLGAHAVGREYAGRQEEYVQHICSEMLPAVAAEGLADYVDVFCDKGFFTVEQTSRILEKAAEYGIIPKIHANELDVSGGVQVGVEHGALSVDHLERTTEAEMEVLKDSRTMPTMLPGCSFFLGLPYGNAKGYIDAGLPVALASDYNPGSSPSGDMRFVMALGCIRMRLTPEQAFNACTLNSAYAMGVSDSLGSITEGKTANLIITRPLPSLAFMTYSHQTPFIGKVILEGNI